MSFAKAPVKRFNEKEGCAPPPGHYSVVSHDKSVGVLKFDNNLDRFKSLEPLTSESSATTFNTPAPPRSSKKKLNFSSGEQGHDQEPGKRSGTVKVAPSGTPKELKEKQAYEREIRQLLQVCNTTECELKSCRMEVSRLEARVVILTKDKLCLESKLGHVEKDILVLQKKNKWLLEQEAKQLKSITMDQELKTARNQLQTLKQQMERKRLQVAGLESDLQAAKSRISALQEANKVLENLNCEIEKHGDDVTEQVGRLQALADKLRAENGQLQENLRTCEAKTRSSETQLVAEVQAAVEASKSSFDIQIKNLNATVDHYQDKLESASIKIEQLRCGITELKASRTDLQKCNSRLESQLAHLKNDHKFCVDEKSNLMSQAECLSRQLEVAQISSDDAQSKLQDAEEKLARLSKESEETQTKLKEECEDYRRDFEHEREASSTLKDKLDDLTSTNTELQRETTTLIAQNEALRQSVENAKEEASDLRTSCESLSAKLSCAETENSALNGRWSNLASELAVYKDRLTSEEEKADHLESQLAALSKTDKTRQGREKNLENVIESLRQSAKDADAANEARLNEFTRRIFETQKKLNQRESDMKSAKEEAQNALNELQTLRCQTTSQNEEKDMEIKSLKHMNEILEKKVERLQQDVAKMEEQHSERNSENGTQSWKSLYEELLEKVKPFKSQLDAYSTERSMLLNETNAAQAELSQLGKKYADLLGHQNHRQKIRHVVKINEENATLKQENLKLKNQVSALKQQIISTRKSKLDPSRAFQHLKENANPSAADER